MVEKKIKYFLRTYRVPRRNRRTRVHVIAERVVLAVLGIVRERRVFWPGVCPDGTYHTREFFGGDDSCCMYCRKVKSGVPCSRGDGTGGGSGGGGSGGSGGTIFGRSMCPCHGGLLLDAKCGMGAWFRVWVELSCVVTGCSVLRL